MMNLPKRRGPAGPQRIMAIYNILKLHRNIFGTGLVALLFILGTVLLSACGGDSPADPLQKAPNFALKDLNGQEVTLTQFLGQPVMLNFWASWCAPCRLEMPLMEATYQKHKDEGLAILAINSGESPEAAQAFVTENKLTFPILMDENLEVSNLIYRLRGLPVSIFIDREGNLVARHVGTLNERLMAEYVGKIMK